MRNLKITAFLLSIILSIALFACKKDEGPQIGIVVPTGDQKVSSNIPFVIHGIIKDSPGHKAGLQENDVIVQIDGREVKGLKHGYVYKNMLLGKRGTVVTLVVRRGEEKHVIQVVRGGKK